MRIVSTKDMNTVKNFLKLNAHKGIYVYIDFIECGIDNSEVIFWIDQSKPNCVLMKYYDSAQFIGSCSEDELEEIAGILETLNLKMISGDELFIRHLYEHTAFKKLYHLSVGYNFEFTTYKTLETNEIIQQASLSDIDEIVELLLKDDNFFSNYTAESLKLQLKNRIENNEGRSFIIRKDNRIVAHIATYAEINDLAVTSGLVVDLDYQNKMLGYLLENYLVRVLMLENKQVFTQVIKTNRVRLLKAMNARECGRYGKLTKKR